MIHFRLGWFIATVLGLSVALRGDAKGQCNLPYDTVFYSFSPDPTFGGEFAVNMLVHDLNGDGFGDVLATDALKSPGGVIGAGKVFVLYGPTLATWTEIAPSQPTSTENMGYRDLSLGDVDGDGAVDLLVGSPGYDAGGTGSVNIGRAHLFLGPDFTTDIVFDDPAPQVGGRFGFASKLIDLDGDGLDDVVIGAPEKTVTTGPHATFTKCGEAWVWNATRLSGRPTAIPHPSPKKTALFGRFLAGVPGASGRGRDLLIASPGWVQPSGFGTGNLFRYEGASLAFIEQIPPPGINFFQFADVFHVGDIDLDGEDDLLVGASDALNKATILLGPDFTTALATVNERTNQVGFAETGAMADLDRDGSLDMLVGDPGAEANQGYIRIYAGPEYSVMESLGCSSPPTTGVGNGLAAGDIDGDGFPEVMSQHPGGFSGGVLWVWKRRTLQADAASFSISAGATVQFSLDLSDAQAGKTYLAVLSLTDPGAGLILGPGVYLPLQPDSMTNIGLSLLGTPIFQGFAGVLDGEGQASFALNWPAGAGGGLVGKTLRVAVITAGPGSTLAVGSSQVAIELLP